MAGEYSSHRPIEESNPVKSDSQEIVQRLWSYCNILRDDGLSYPDYVEQLTYLLFLKMAQEHQDTSASKRSIIPSAYGWKTLMARTGKDLHAHYGSVLNHLATGTRSSARMWNTEEKWQTKSAWDLRFRLRPPMLYLMYLVWSLPSFSKTQRNVMNREGK
jgi:hypothetical protein